MVFVPRPLECILLFYNLNLKIFKFAEPYSKIEFLIDIIDLNSHPTIDNSNYNNLNS